MEDAIFKDYANGGRHLFQSWWIRVVLAAKDRALVDDLTIINCCTCRIRWSIYFVAAEDKKSKYCRSIRFWCTTAMIHNNQPPSYSFQQSYATIYITYHHMQHIHYISCQIQALDLYGEGYAKRRWYWVLSAQTHQDMISLMKRVTRCTSLIPGTNANKNTTLTANCHLLIDMFWAIGYLFKSTCLE